jgi:hypothetical protein
MLRAISELAQGPAVAPQAPGATASKPQEAERRQLRVMFCDLVGSTAGRRTVPYVPLLAIALIGVIMLGCLWSFGWTTGKIAIGQLEKPARSAKVRKGPLMRAHARSSVEDTRRMRASRA